MLRVLIISVSILANILIMHPVAAASDQQLRLAVASNFHATLTKLAAIFEQEVANSTIVISSGASGQLAAQIVNGAPFDVFLSADQASPAFLLERGFGKDDIYTYAIGRLVWAQHGAANNSQNITEQINSVTGKIALANPKLAPYGRAAQDFLEKKSLWAGRQQKLVFGNNIAQTAAYFESGAVDAAFIALSQASAIQNAMPHTQFTVIAADHHMPIKQDMIRLRDKRMARLFMDFMRSDETKALIVAAGYDLPKTGKAGND